MVTYLEVLVINCLGHIESSHCVNLNHCKKVDTLLFSIMDRRNLYNRRELMKVTSRAPFIHIDNVSTKIIELHTESHTIASLAFPSAISCSYMYTYNITVPMCP